MGKQGGLAGGSKALVVGAAFDASSTGAERRRRPLEAPNLLLRLAPYMAVSAVALGVTNYSSSSFRSPYFMAAAVVIVCLWAMAALVPWRRVPAGMQVLLPFASLVAIFLIRSANPGDYGGTASLVLLPLVWTAVYGGTRRELAAMLAGAAVALYLPVATRYSVNPEDHYRLATSVIVIGALMAFTLEQLVRQLDQQSVELGRLARTDTLTGLANRRLLDDEVPEILERAKRNKTTAVVAILDLDHFKAYNDRFGHGAGDRLLLRAGCAWKQHLRPDDLLIRLGGEEFLVVVCCPVDIAQQLLERLVAATPDQETCSVGSATWDGVETIEAVMARADAALYEAKHAGRNRLVMAAA